MIDDDDGSPWGWLDMGRYPDLDPDHAVPAATLGTLHDFLLGGEIAPLPDEAWATAVGGALLTSGHDAGPAETGAGQAEDSAGDGPDDHVPPAAGWSADPWAGGHDGLLPGLFPGSHEVTDPLADGGGPHSDGGHW
jgi:hypothetical protein